MEPDEAQLRRVPDAGVLATLPSGVQVVRRKKHEPIEIAGLSREELVSRTNRRMGSKWLPGTDLVRIVEITRDVLRENDAQLGANQCYHKVYDHPIGICSGRLVKAVQVRTSVHGRCAHAYPEVEQEA